jgi:hypothetical protein
MRKVVCGWDNMAKGFKGRFSFWGGMETKESENEYACNRVYKDDFHPHVEPKFSLSKNDAVFTSGSCFAREIEGALKRNGVKVADRYFKSNNYVMEGRNSDIALFNRFNTATIADEIISVCTPATLDGKLIYELPGGNAFDAYFSPAQLKHTKQEKVQIRKEILTYQNEFVQNAGAVFVTLGLNEAVYDNEFDAYLNGAPVLGKFNLANKHRFEGHVFSVDDTIKYLDKSRNAIKKFIGAEVKMIVTVSPVPLLSTFTGKDVVVANQASKAVLRAATDIFSSEYDDVDYWPSYEMVVYSNPDTAWAKDKRHVDRKNKVPQIMDYFVEKYYGHSPEA